MSSAVFLGIGFALFWVPLIAESVTSWMAVNIARTRHPVLWEHSGRPTLMGNGSLPNAWPLVRYYRDRGWLKKQRPHRDAARTEGQGLRWLEPVTDSAALAFAESLRRPLVWTYWAAWSGVAASTIFMLVGGVVFF